MLGIQRAACAALIALTVIAMAVPQVAASDNRVSCGLATGQYPVTSYPHLAGLATCIKQGTTAPVSGIKVNWFFGYPNLTVIAGITHTGNYTGVGYVDSFQPATNSSGLASIYARNEGALSGPNQVLICIAVGKTHSMVCVFFQ